MTDTGYTYHNREISWLAFNHRVLQEAVNDDIPLFERIKFLAIYHSNLDEFFRVRVAWIKRLSELAKGDPDDFEYPKGLLEQIYTIVEGHYSELDRYFYKTVIPELESNKILLLDEKRLIKQEKEYLREFSYSNILPFLQPSLLAKGKVVSFLKNKTLYMGLQLVDKTSNEKQYAFVEIPTWKTKRFIQFPKSGSTFDYIMLDDAVRFLLPDIFPGYHIKAMHSFMVNRDAELYIEDEVSGNLVEKIKASLARRESGSPIGFIFDRKMPIEMLRYLVQNFDIAPESVIVGSRYLNMADFMNFPNPLSPDLEYKPWPRVGNKNFDKYDSIFDAIKAKDRLLSVPYQGFEYVLELLETAMNDSKVSRIDISLYRTSDRSKVARLLIQAARKGKKVTAFVELKARFDEQSNLDWAQEMESSGVEVIYSMPKLKVHSKLLLITRIENQVERRYTYIGTGNFNRITAKFYCDHALITADERIAEEVVSIFNMLKNQLDHLPHFEHLLVAPHQMRNKFYSLIDYEIEQAKLGNEAKIVIKVNSLEDQEIIDKLYEASNAGVRIRMIVRGICCLVPGVPNQSENIEIISIIDRYLEHARIFKFHHAGEELMFMGSADWMTRNLSRRVEVVTPIYERTVKKQVNRVLEYQFRDNVKARIIDAELSNKFKEKGADGRDYQAQRSIQRYFEKLAQRKRKY